MARSPLQMPKLEESGAGVIAGVRWCRLTLSRSNTRIASKIPIHPCRFMTTMQVHLYYILIYVCVCWNTVNLALYVMMLYVCLAHWQVNMCDHYVTCLARAWTICMRDGSMADPWLDGVAGIDVSEICFPKCFLSWKLRNSPCHTT